MVGPDKNKSRETSSNQILFKVYSTAMSRKKISNGKILLSTVNFNGLPNTVAHRKSMSAITWPRKNKQK